MFRSVLDGLLEVFDCAGRVAAVTGEAADHVVGVGEVLLRGNSRLERVDSARLFAELHEGHRPVEMRGSEIRPQLHAALEGPEGVRVEVRPILELAEGVKGIHVIRVQPCSGLVLPHGVVGELAAVVDLAKGPVGEPEIGVLGYGLIREVHGLLHARGVRRIVPQVGKTGIGKCIGIVGLQRKGLLERPTRIPVSPGVEKSGPFLEEVLNLLLALFLRLQALFLGGIGGVNGRLLRLYLLLNHDLLLLVLQLVPELVQPRPQLLLLGQERRELLLLRGVVRGLLPGQHVIECLLDPGVVDIEGVEDLEGFFELTLSRVVVGLLEARGNPACLRGPAQGDPEPGSAGRQNRQDDDPRHKEPPRWT